MFWRERYDRQRTLVIRITTVALASDSLITVRRFCPSKLWTKMLYSRLKATIATNIVPSLAMREPCLGTHVGTPALKTKNFTNKIGRF